MTKMDQVEAEVSGMLEQSGVAMGGMQMLHVPATAMWPGAAYTVDHASRSVVERAPR